MTRLKQVIHCYKKKELDSALITQIKYKKLLIFNIDCSDTSQ